MQKPVAKKIVIRDKKGKNVKTFQMPSNMNLIELAVWTKEMKGFFVVGEWARPCTVTIEDYKGNVQFSRAMKVNWKYLKRDIRELLRSYEEGFQEENLEAMELGLWAA